MPAETHASLGRNDPCHCGSGRKYKQCCLEKDEAAAREARAKAGESSAPSAEAEAARAAPPPPPRQATHQPWRRGQAGTNTPRFNIPRRSGGS